MCCIFLLDKDWKKKLVGNYKSLIIISLTGIFFIYLFSYFNSENKTEYWNVLKNKIPFLFIPISILSINSLSKMQLKLIKYVFIICSLLSSIWSYYQYFQNPEKYIELYSVGQVIPTIIHHISFSFLLIVAILFVLTNVLNANNKIEILFNLILLLWFTYFIHLLSVRTGIVLLYISFFLFALSTLIVHKRVVFAGGLIAILILSFNYSYQKIPTIKNKVDYTVYSLKQYRNNSDTFNQTSDTRRILSDKIGLSIIQEHKYVGVGFGDIQDEMIFIYKTKYPAFTKEVYSKIHNQYLYVTASVGLILGIIFIILLLFPLIQFIKNKSIVFAISYLLLLMLMLWESFIENQLGTSIFLVICCLGFLDKQKSSITLSNNE
jgi:O-antigen ligase